jgi:hypothetical protein
VASLSQAWLSGLLRASQVERTKLERTRSGSIRRILGTIIACLDSGHSGMSVAYSTKRANLSSTARAGYPYSTVNPYSVSRGTPRSRGGSRSAPRAIEETDQVHRVNRSATPRTTTVQRPTMVHVGSKTAPRGACVDCVGVWLLLRFAKSTFWT